MAGGLLNIVSHGISNILIYGNPHKSIFKSKYKKITNFGQQKFKTIPQSNETLSEFNETTYRFKISRHGDLLGDTYLCIDIPDIWSAIYKKTVNGNIEYTDIGFKWIKELGTNLINEVTVESGGQILAKYTGEYFSAIAHRDNKNKIDLWNEMTGNIKELYDPAYAYNRNGSYPHAYFDYVDGNPNYQDREILPSIYGRRLYVPLDMWFTKSPSSALPLIALQYSTIYIVVKLKPLNQLYTVLDYLNNEKAYVKPEKTLRAHRFGVFLRPPETNDIERIYFDDTKLDMNLNIHLLSNYYYLDSKERTEFAGKEHMFLVNDVYNETFLNMTGDEIVDLNVKGLVSSYMMRLRRSDSFKRNEWSNYTNHLYDHLPYNLSLIDDNKTLDVFQTEKRNFDGSTIPTDIQDYMKSINKRQFNRKEILESMEILLDGIERETTMDMGVYRYIEPYARTKYEGKPYMYYYNFCSNMNTYDTQPTGGMNLEKFKDIQIKIRTILPPLTVGYEGAVITERKPDPVDCNGPEIITKRAYYVYEYNYDMEVFTERYNVIKIQSGLIGLLFAR